MYVPKVNGYYVSPGTFITDSRRSIQSRFGLYKRQPPLDKVGGVSVVSNPKAQEAIADAILQKRAYAAGRLGTVEGDLLHWKILHPNLLFPSSLLRNGKTLAGVFPPTQANARQFVEAYLEEVKNLDFLGVRNKDFFSGYFKMESHVVEKTLPKTLGTIDSLSPLGEDSSWVEALRGKRILVVHPFAKTILAQYELNRRDLFPNPNWLPEFNLQVYTPFQTAGEDNPQVKPLNWLEALNAMIDDISKLSFDVALVSAGAYGLPLATAIKQMGRVGIHIGGVLQLFFGIRGGRWDAVSSQYEALSKYHSNSWVRPTKDETPTWNKSVEGGAYW